MLSITQIGTKGSPIGLESSVSKITDKLIFVIARLFRFYYVCSCYV